MTDFQKLIEEQIAEQERINPVKPGFVRVYEDHTYRWYQDIPEEDLEYKPGSIEHEMAKIIREEIDKEILKQIIEGVEKSRND